MAQTADDAARSVRWSDGGGFAVVPEWLLDANVSDRAVRLYAVLGRFADRHLEAVVTRKQIADRLVCSTSTLDVAMKELRDLGAVVVEARISEAGDKAANSYMLRTTLPSLREGCTEQPVEGCTEQPVIRERDVMQEREGAKAPSQALVADDDPPPIRKIGGQNQPLNALVEECGIDPGNRQRMRWAVSALNGRGNDQGIVHLFWLEANRWCVEHDRRDEISELRADSERFSNGLVAAIRRKAALYRQAMDGARLTPTALRNWWLDLERQQQRPGGGMSPSDIEKM